MRKVRVEDQPGWIYVAHALGLWINEGRIKRVGTVASAYVGVAGAVAGIEPEPRRLLTPGRGRRRALRVVIAWPDGRTMTSEAFHFERLPAMRSWVGIFNAWAAGITGSQV